LLVAMQIGICFYFAQFALIDDAYIAFRYAENFVEGHGLVFNLGERVEGYTCFLWILLLAVLTALDTDLVVGSQLLGALCLVMTVVVTARLLPRVQERPVWSQMIAPTLLAANGASAMWSVHGLETAMFTLLLSMALRADLRGHAGGRIATGWSGVWYALAALTRPEAALVFAASLLFWVYASRRALGSASIWRAILPFAAIVIPHELWRYHYYGYLLPNTFHAKVGMSMPLLARGAAYLLDFFKGAQALFFLPILLTFRAARLDRRIAFLLWILAAWSIVVVLEGGDAFPAWRFFVPILPIVYLLVQEGIYQAVGWGRSRGDGLARALSVGLLLVALAAAPVHLRRVFEGALEEARGAHVFTRNMKLVGDCLARHLPASARIALNPVGAVAYHSGLYAYDMMGLTNLNIAHRSVSELGAGYAGHEKGDGAYILTQKPDVILFGNVQISPTGPVDLETVRWNETLLSEREIARDPRRSSLYVPDQLPLGDGRYLLFLRRNDFVITRQP
jgi:hypothetical protein